MNFNLVKRECKKPLFWQYDEFNNFVTSYKYNKITFDKFLGLLDEYYLIKYSCKLSRNAWLVFNWLRFMSKKDGFVYASYEAIIKVFCREGTKISRPTFFKCISELEENDLIVSIQTKNSLYGDTINGSNIYGIVDKSYFIYEICDIIECNVGMSIYDAIDVIAFKKQKKLFDVVDNDKKVSKKKPKLSDDKKYKLMMSTTFKPITNEIEEMFQFVGSYNKTGKIAMSRKVKILNGLKEYLACDFVLSDFVQAINIMMKNTRVGKNPYRERYMFKILENMCEYDGDVVENKVANELSKKAEQKLQINYNKPQSHKSVQTSVSFTKSSYDVEKTKLMKNEGHFRAIIRMFTQNRPSNNYEDNLLKLALAIKKKFDAYDDNNSSSIARIESMRKRDCYEIVEYDEKWNRIISWEDSDGNPIPKKKAFSYFEEDGVVVKFSKYDSIGG